MSTSAVNVTTVRRAENVAHLVDLASARLIRKPWLWADALRADRNLTSGDRDVAAALASFVNRKSGTAWPSLAAIAKKLNKSERQIRRSLSKLAKLGYLNAEGKGGTVRTANGLQGRTRIYKLSLPGHVAEKSYPDMEGHIPGHGCPPNLKNKPSEPKDNRSGSKVSEERARSNVGRLAAFQLGFSESDRAPDGRYYDAIALAALPTEILAPLIDRFRRGCGDAVDVHDALASAGVTREILPKPVKTPEPAKSLR